MAHSFTLVVLLLCRFLENTHLWFTLWVLNFKKVLKFRAYDLVFFSFMLLYFVSIEECWKNESNISCVLIHEWKNVTRISFGWKLIHIISWVSFQIRQSGDDMAGMRNKEHTSILLTGKERYYSVPRLHCIGLKLFYSHVYLVCLGSLHIVFVYFFSR